MSWIGAVAVFLVATLGSAESHVRARLVADTARLQAGESFFLGVLLDPEPGWHVYWRNPGEAGLATEVTFDLPEGFEVGPLRWPTPVAFEQPGGIVGYGYEDPVVLAAEVRAPDRLPTSTSVALTASWLACKNVCVLGSAKLTAELPFKGAELEASKTAFETWVETLPTEVEPGRFDVSVIGGPVPESGPADLAVWLSWREPPGAVEFFPDPRAGLKVEGVRTRTRGALTRIDFRMSRLTTSGAPAKTLRALVVTEGQRGARSAVITLIELEKLDRPRRSNERNEQ